MVGHAGFEPATTRLKVECSTTELMTRYMRARRDSNPQPSVPKTDALSVELQALIGWVIG
jgi:hypothetical protein